VHFFTKNLTLNIEPQLFPQPHVLTNRAIKLGSAQQVLRAYVADKGSSRSKNIQKHDL
jgi:hypothetical protein